MRDGKQADLKEYDKGWFTTEDQFLGGVAGTFASRLIGSFIKKYAPEFGKGLGLFVERLSGYIFVGTVLKSIVDHYADKMTKIDLKRRYAVDADRRSHMKDIGEGTYVGVSEPAASGQ